MSILVVLIPPRQRISARSAGAAEPPAARAGREYDYVISPDGLVLGSQGRCAASLLPRATTVIAVLADGDVSWHPITLPKAPAARLRAALDGVLEEALLDEPEAVHLALAPLAAAGQRTWVAAVDRRWLRTELEALEKVDVFIDRVVPIAWPDDPPMGHFAETAADPNGPAQTIALHWAHANGVASLRLQGRVEMSPLPVPEAPRLRAVGHDRVLRWMGAPVTGSGST